MKNCLLEKIKLVCDVAVVVAFILGLAFGHSALGVVGSIILIVMWVAITILDFLTLKRNSKK